jgi:hypothetical protein
MWPVHLHYRCKADKGRWWFEGRRDYGNRDGIGKVTSILEPIPHENKIISAHQRLTKDVVEWNIQKRKGGGRAITHEFGTPP